MSWEVVHNPIFFPCLPAGMSCSSSVWENELPWEAVSVAGRAAMHVHLVSGFNLPCVGEYKNLKENRVFCE